MTIERAFSITFLIISVPLFSVTLCNKFEESCSSDKVS
jgi:hypothetical protein